MPKIIFILDLHEHIKRIPSDLPPSSIEKPSTCIIPTPIFASKQHPIVPITSTSITAKLMNQMKNLPAPSTTTNITLTSAIQSISTTSYFNDYEITDTDSVSIKKPTTTIASFPPRSTSTTTDVIDPTHSSNSYEFDAPISNEPGIRFGTTPAPQITPPVYVKKFVQILIFFSCL